MGVQLWRHIPGHALLWALNLFSAVALIFEGQLLFDKIIANMDANSKIIGYNQGVMGFVNGVPDYIETVGIGSNGVVTNTTKQGGLVAIYYFGAMFGCFIGGRFGDKFGRKKAVIVGSIFTLIGGALQAGSQSSDMTLVARVICGLGIGFINSVCLQCSDEIHQINSLFRSFRHGCPKLQQLITVVHRLPSSSVPTISELLLLTGLGMDFATIRLTSDGDFH